MRMPGPGLTHLDARTAIVLDNITCVYCNAPLDDAGSTKEHTIGRRFIPRGKLDGSWNLIVRACSPCNARKADLEDDLSAVVMHPDSAGEHARDDEVLVAEAGRKAAKSISRRTGKPVQQSSESLTFQVQPAPGITFTFNMSSPPQFDAHRAFELARFQLAALFYWITFNRETKRGGFWLGSFFPVHSASRADWGNPVHRAFMEAISTWEPRVLAIVADGYFKVAIRRHPDAICWSWALEWNSNLRLIGFCGEQEPARAVVSTFPPLKTQAAPQPDGSQIRFRLEVPLEAEDDILFSNN